MIPRSPVAQSLVRTSTLEIAYEERGGTADPPVVLLHGFPYDPRAFDEVVARLVHAGCRTIVPYLRGFGATRFVSPATPRSGQQAALGNDVRELLDALGISRAVLAGYDWGGRAACVVAALWPERVRALITVNGYNIQDIAAAVRPADPEQEHRLWYQYYFHTERGRAGLAANRRALCRLCWRLWSPSWRFDDATFDCSAASFDHPDFVEVVIHSYRHRFGYAAGDPAFEPLERRLAELPSIAAPTIALDGEDDGVIPAAGSHVHARRFTGPYARRLVPGCGHNVPQEAPEAFAAAVLELVRATT
ncbi:MAG TPA: alpha/beta hydrolase [Kofleriaceae bacterium]|nr:alpha/beta hydrolase [Kofleriaceae bacterium]